MYLKLCINYYLLVKNAKLMARIFCSHNFLAMGELKDWKACKDMRIERFMKVLLRFSKSFLRWRTKQSDSMYNTLKY